MRQRVGAEKGRGAVWLSGRLELRTSCDARWYALSGSWSKTDLFDVAVTSAGAAAGALCLADTSLDLLAGLVLKLKPFDIWRFLEIDKAEMSPGSNFNNRVSSCR